MDRQLAERMVGAACLLAVLVLVVPAILDGNPDSGATITHPSVDESLGLRAHTIRLDRADRDPPVSVSPESSARPEPQPQPQPQPEYGSAPSAAPPAAASGGPAPIPVREPVRPLAQEALPGRGDWFVQLGSFSRQDNADRLAAELQGKGFGASVLSGGGASGTLFRVRAGPEVDRAAAEALAGRLAVAGFTGGRIGKQ